MNHKDFIDEVDNKDIFSKRLINSVIQLFCHTQKDMDIITTVILQRLNQKL